MFTIDPITIKWLKTANSNSSGTEVLVCYFTIAILWENNIDETNDTCCLIQLIQTSIAELPTSFVARLPEVEFKLDSPDYGYTAFGTSATVGDETYGMANKVHLHPGDYVGFMPGSMSYRWAYALLG